MDAQVTWQAMLTAAAKRDWATASEKAKLLLAWIDKRGKPPVTNPLPNLPRSWHHTVTYFTCHLVLGWRKRHPRTKSNDPRAKP